MMRSRTLRRLGTRTVDSVAAALALTTCLLTAASCTDRPEISVGPAATNAGSAATGAGAGGPVSDPAISPLVAPEIEILLTGWDELHLADASNESAAAGPIALCTFEQLRDRMRLPTSKVGAATVTLAKSCRLDAEPPSAVAERFLDIGFDRVVVRLAMGVFSTEPHWRGAVLFDSFNNR